MSKFLKVNVKDPDRVTYINIDDICAIEGNLVIMKSLKSVLASVDNFGRKLYSEEPTYHLEAIMFELTDKSLKTLISILNYA